MCGRYYIAEDEPMSKVLADVVHQSDLKLGEIYPTSLAPVILPGGEVQLSFGDFPGMTARADHQCSKRNHR